MNKLRNPAIIPLAPPRPIDPKAIDLKWEAWRQQQLQKRRARDESEVARNLTEAKLW